MPDLAARLKLLQGRDATGMRMWRRGSARLSFYLIFVLPL